MSFSENFLLSPAATTTKDFGSRSFIEWDFKEDFYVELEGKLHKTSLHVMFRTRQASGLLLKAQNAQKSEYLLIEVSCAS